jgi:dihydroneopterin aldolase
LLTVSLHKIRIHGKHGVYPEEAILGNWFEVDVDITMHADASETWPYVDYSLINDVVREVFSTPTQLLETLVKNIHQKLKLLAPDGNIVKVSIRKLNPSVNGDAAYSQVSFEQ